MGPIYGDIRDFSSLLFLLGLCLAWAAFDGVKYATDGTTVAATVTQVTQTPPADEAGKPVLSVHYRFQELPRWAKPPCPPPASLDRCESAPLPPDDPAPAVGDTITISYVPGHVGLSRVSIHHDLHYGLALLIAVAMFTLATARILWQRGTSRKWPGIR